MVNLPTRTPLSFIYFGAAGVAAYFANDVEALRWLAYAAAMMFFVRGPLLYVRDFVEHLQDENARNPETVLLVTFIITYLVEWLGYGLVGYWLLKFAAAL